LQSAVVIARWLQGLMQLGHQALHRNALNPVAGAVPDEIGRE